MVEETTQAPEATNEEEAAAPAEAEPAELNLNDLAALRSIIDAASSRGAFKPNEMVAVGQTYNKLAAFLESAAKQAEESQKNG